MKTCSRCQEDKPLLAFQRRAAARDGRQAWCRSCTAAYNTEHRNRPGMRERQQRQARARYTPAQRKESGLLSRYGLSLADYAARLETQGGRCMICSTELDGGKHTHVDHCHATGRVRDLLCSLCNKGIGSLRDDSALLRKAADYIDLHTKETKHGEAK